MRYLVTTKHHKPFLTKCFELENHFNVLHGMIVYDLTENKFTIDGETWVDIDIHHL
jgi:hypothetical protein